MKSINKFAPKRDHLICFDSDGCIMNTMEIKHALCFGPCMIQEWNLSHLGKQILERWKEINLYTITRGINRYRGLAMALTEIDEKYERIKGVDKLNRWVSSSSKLSEEALKNEIAKNPDEVIFQKALEWSLAVNQAIDDLPNEKKLPFPLSREALELSHRHADVAIVSAANYDAMIEEWEMHGFLKYVDVILSQSDGKKAICLQKLIQKGYQKDRLLMCGDAEGDLLAAEQNKVNFFPILVGREEESLHELMSEGIKRLLCGSYVGEYQEKKKKEFYKNLGE